MMQFTVLCEGEAIGHADFAVTRGHASAPFRALPAFERIRPVLDRFERALFESARRLHANGAADGSGGAGQPSSSATGPSFPSHRTSAYRIGAELAQLIDLDSVRAIAEPARQLRLELQDSAGTRVATRHVGIRILPGGAGAAWVTVALRD